MKWRVPLLAGVAIDANILSAAHSEVRQKNSALSKILLPHTGHAPTPASGPYLSLKRRT